MSSAAAAAAAAGAARYNPNKRRRKSHARYQRALTPRYGFAPMPRAPMGPETKYWDVGIKSSTAWAGSTWNGSIVEANEYVNGGGSASTYPGANSSLIPSWQGTGYGQVVGNHYNFKQIRVRGRVVAPVLSNSATMVEPIFGRILLVMDTAPNGVQSPGEEVLQDTGGTAPNLYSFKRVSENASRYRILKDEFFTLQPSTAANDQAGGATSTIGFEGYSFSWAYKPRVPFQVSIGSGMTTPGVSNLRNCNIFLMLAGIRSEVPAVLDIVGGARVAYTG